jgi:hypothetical protein
MHETYQRFVEVLWHRPDQVELEKALSDASAALGLAHFAYPRTRAGGCKVESEIFLDADELSYGVSTDCYGEDAELVIEVAAR